MNPARRPLVAGNWKMNAGGPDARPLAAAVARAAEDADRVDVLVAPPLTSLAAVAAALDAAGSTVWSARQNMSQRPRAPSPARSPAPCSATRARRG